MIHYQELDLQTIAEGLYHCRNFAKKKSPMELRNWKLCTKVDIPKQRNGSDCGVFMCQFADCISRDKVFEFDQKDMQYFRQRGKL